MTRFDTVPDVFASAAPSDDMDALNAYINEAFGGSDTKSRTASIGWESKRKQFDAAGLARDYEGVEFRPDTLSIDGREMTGSWTLLPNSDPERRLLYIHGGAFTVGSDISHRPLTLAQIHNIYCSFASPPLFILQQRGVKDEGEDLTHFDTAPDVLASTTPSDGMAVFTPDAGPYAQGSAYVATACIGETLWHASCSS